MFKTIYIWYLRRKAKIMYECYTYNDIGCGLTLRDHISPQYREYAEEFNRIMVKLKEIDPNFPPTEPPQL